jgi:hypothetical protein
MSPNTKLIGLRFILGQGAFISVALPEQTAREIVKTWQTGKNTGGILGFADFPQGPWAIRADSIQGIHSFDLQEAARQAGLASTFPNSGRTM